MEFSRKEWVAILLQEIFPSQGSNPRLLCLRHGQTDPLPLRHLGLSLFHLVSSPPQVNSGLDTWYSQCPKGETHIKVSWGQSQNLRSFLSIISCSQIKLHGTPRLKGQRKRFLPPEGRKGYVCSFALNLFWGTLIHESATMRWKFIHNSGHKFRPQTLLTSKFLARYSLSFLSGSESLPQKLGNLHGMPAGNFPIGSVGKEPPAYEGDMGNMGLISVGPQSSKWHPTAVFLPENSLDRGPGRLHTVHRATKSQTELSACVHTHTHTHTHGMSAMKLMPFDSLISFYTYCGFLSFFFYISRCLSIQSLNTSKSKVSILVSPFFFAFSEWPRVHHSFFPSCPHSCSRLSLHSSYL